MELTGFIIGRVLDMNSRHGHLPIMRTVVIVITLVVAFCSGAAGQQSPNEVFSVIDEANRASESREFGRATTLMTEAITMLTRLVPPANADLAWLHQQRASLAQAAYGQGQISLQVLQRIAEAALPNTKPFDDLHLRATLVASYAALTAAKHGRARVLAEEAFFLAESMLDTAPACLAAESLHMSALAVLRDRRPSDIPKQLQDNRYYQSCPRLENQRQVLLARGDLQRGNFERARAALEAVLTRPDIAPEVVGEAQYHLAEIDLMQGRYAAAELSNEAARAAYMQVTLDHPILAQIDHRAAMIRQELGDAGAAEVLYGTAVRELAERLGEAHPLTLAARRERLLLLADRAQFSEALPEASNVVALAEQPHARALALGARGLVLHAMAPDAPKTRAALVKAQAAFAALPGTDIDRTPTLVALARFDASTGELASAEGYIREAIALLEGQGSETVQRLGEARRVLADILVERGDRSGALRLATLNHETAMAEMATALELPTYAAQLRPQEVRRQVAQHVDLLWRQAQSTSAPEALDRLFRAAQLAHLHAGAFGTRGVARAALSDTPGLALALEEIAALTSTIRGLERVLRAGLDPEAAARTRSRIVNLQQEAESRRDQVAEDPGMQAWRRLAAPRTRGLAEVQATLAADQAMWFHAAFEEFFLVAAISANDTRMVRVPISRGTVRDEVAQLRRAVDELPPPPALPRAEDYPAASAHALYCMLLDPVFGSEMARCDTARPEVSGSETLGAGRLSPPARLVLVPDGAIQQVALATLLMQPTADLPTRADLRAAHWLGRHHAVLISPSVPAFLGREPAKAEPRARPFVGFAPFGRRCTPTTKLVEAAKPRDTKDANTANPQLLASLSLDRINGTARSVRTVARLFDAEEDQDWFQCEAASEAELRRQDLSDAGTLMIASHAEVGQLPPGLPEPGIFFAVPGLLEANNDGYLKASEIASLRLNVDLVLLSACSTASDAGLPGAPGLSGLASAFFEAGAHALAVSQWDVASVSTGKLTERLLHWRNEAPDLPVEESMRRAMQDLREGPVEAYAHPFFWAPFMIVAG